MKNICKILGIITFVAVIGFSISACDDNNTVIRITDFYSFSTGTPSSSLLLINDITAEQFNQIATGTDYQGWAEDDGNILLLWTNKSLSDYDNIKTELYSLLSGKYPFEDGDRNSYIVYSFQYGSYRDCDIEFFNQTISNTINNVTFEVIKGTLLVTLW